MTYKVFFLEIVTKNDIEDTQSLKGRVISQMKCWCKPGFHAKRLIKFVLVTSETLEQLHERLSEFLFELRDLGSIERFVMSEAPTAVITDHGQMDALAHYLREGRVEAAERNKANDLRNRQWRQRRV